MNVRHKYLETGYRITLKWIIKRIYVALMQIVFSLVLKLFKSESDVSVYKYKIAICAIFKDEATYFKEWIEFHIIAGVDHFYLYNNFSSDDYMSVLKPYIEKGLVTLVDWPVKQGQMSAYKDCIKKFRNETEWIGFIDLDEFVIPNHDSSLYDFLKKFNKRPSVLFYWRYMGSSGRIKRDFNGLVTEDFTVCWHKYGEVGKCFYNTRYDLLENERKNVTFHHFLWCKGPFHMEIPPCNVFGKFCMMGINVFPIVGVDAQDFPAQVNHYVVKSYQEYVQKYTKGDVFYENNPHREEFFYAHDVNCTDVDYHAYRFLSKLKMSIGKA